jgi:hypothetical protein
MALVRALHVRRPWPDFELHGRPWGSLPEREERGKGRGEGQERGCKEEEGWEGRHGEGLHGGEDSVLVLVLVLLLGRCSLCSCKLLHEEERRKERRQMKEENEGKEKKEEKSVKFFPN